MTKRLVLLLVALLAAARAAAAEQPKTLRVYFVGNSVTDTINYRALAELAKSRGHVQLWGRHMIPGAPLEWIWNHPNDGFQEPPYGHYPSALANHEWDVLSLQPFDRHLEGDSGDLAMAGKFIDLALTKSPEVQVYVYARWPRQGKDDFDTAWLKKYTGQWDGTNETKDYFERLTLELRKARPNLKKPVLMVPVGHVMYALNQEMKAGRVPGYRHIKELYADGIHLNAVGSYVVGCTFFATLYREDPKDLPGEPYKVSDPGLAEAIARTVWKVVAAHELAGVARPADRRPQDERTSLKGWELYVWNEGGTTRCALLPGTNRLNTAEEIAAAAVAGVDAIEPALAELKPGEHLMILGKSRREMPPGEAAARLSQYGRKLGLDVRALAP